MSNSIERLPAEPGSYLLWLYLRQQHELDVGRLGRFRCRRGWYLYCGSAGGPGGLRARLSHHLRPLRRLHWHIDYLRQIAELRSIWLCQRVNTEHLWSELLQQHKILAPIAGFGSSDCACASHLFWLARKPPLGELKKSLEQQMEAHTKIISKIKCFAV